MTTVIVPWRPGCPARERAWGVVRTLYAATHPDWDVVEAVAPEGPWCKAIAVQPAVEAAPDGVVIVADADVWCDGLADAVHAIESGLAGWAVPHFLVRRLGPGGEPSERPYRGLQGGGFIIARRDTLLDVPFDPRFTGWGQEDAAIGVALMVLHGLPWRGDADLTHFWHPPQPRISRKVGSVAGQQLHRRYLACRRDPAAMRALIEEARRDPDVSPQPASHDHEPAAGRQ